MEKKHLKNIVENYKKWEEDIVKQLTFEWEHGTTIGGFREEIWKDMFERIIPKKFNIARSVFIIDSHENISNEVDLAIYDEQYTPYIFNYGVMKFIPIEAVAAVVECKSKDPDKNGLGNWAESITNLKTSQASIVRVVGSMIIGEDAEKIAKIKDFIEDNKKSFDMQTSTSPIKILCYLPDSETDDIKECEKCFDIVIRAAGKEEKKLDIIFNEGEVNNLYDWYFKLNHTKENKSYMEKNNGSEIENKNINKLFKYQIADYEVSKNKEKLSLLSFIFQFNQLLMLINNPIFFPHLAYVKMFNNHLEKEDNNIKGE